MGYKPNAGDQSQERRICAWEDGFGAPRLVRSAIHPHIYQQPREVSDPFLFVGVDMHSAAQALVKP